MSSHDFTIVLLIAAAFASFGSVLAATIWYSGRSVEKAK